MKQNGMEQIYNVVLLGHGGSGKTSLSEAILFRTGAVGHPGSVAEGNTVSDHLREEQKRKSSIALSLLRTDYQTAKLNLLDAPGSFDFEIEAEEGLLAADGAIIVVSGKSGVTTGVKKAVRAVQKSGKSLLFFVNKLDESHADFYRVFEQLKTEFGPSVCPMVAPVYRNGEIDCYVDLLVQKAYTYSDSGVRVEVEMPNMEHRLEGFTAAISESVAETNEEMFEKYFSGEQFTRQELVDGIHKGVKEGAVLPVFCGSAFMQAGIRFLLDGVVSLLPSADEVAESLSLSSPNSMVAQVFKTVADPFYGTLSYLRVYSGKLETGGHYRNQRTGEDERLGKLFTLCGKQQEPLETIGAGDIGVAVKVPLKTGDVLGELSSEELPKLPEYHPRYFRALSTTSDEGKLALAIQKLLLEDPSLSFEVNQQTRQQLLGGVGVQHLETAVLKLQTRFGIDVSLDEVRIPYRETIRQKVKVQGRHKKQTGGHGQFGDVWMVFEPTALEDLIFEEQIVGGAVPKNDIPAVEKGFRESAQHGVLAGYPLTGVKAIVVDGSYHPVDSSEMAFKLAAGLAYRDGISKASPVLLEPVDRVLVLVPDGNTGDMMGELNRRRGRILGMTPAEFGMTQIEVELPEVSLLDFATVVRQMTQGAGSFTMEFARYEQLPEQLQEEVIEKSNTLKWEK